MRPLLLPLLSFLLSPLPASADEVAAPPPAPAARVCVANFTETGSFFRGRSYATWQEHPSTDYDLAFRAVAQAAAASDWGTVDANKDVGLITAAKGVNGGRGSTAPLNVIVKALPGGTIRVEAKFGIGSGQTAPTETVRDELCKLVEAPATPPSDGAVKPQ